MSSHCLAEGKCTQSPSQFSLPSKPLLCDHSNALHPWYSACCRAHLFCYMLVCFRDYYPGILSWGTCTEGREWGNGLAGVCLGYTSESASLRGLYCPFWDCAHLCRDYRFLCIPDRKECQSPSGGKRFCWSIYYTVR